MTRRAILSVHDKTGLPAFARGLAALGFELVASGGTARLLRADGLAVRDVEELTGSPELLGGRVKTLHPRVHAGILARPDPEQLAELAAHGIGAIDVVVCNLYPFAATIARPDVTEAEAVEQIDIGGVTLLRAAAKNFERVTVVSDPADYERVLAALAEGGPGPEERRALSLQAFRHTATYDAGIADWLGRLAAPDEPLPGALHLAAERAEVLRYGENPHQSGALYRWAGRRAAFEQLQGKELSYNNLLDLDAAWAIPLEFAAPTVAIVKHNTPCGVASADTLAAAYQAAWACDPVSAFGSIIACNRTADGPFVEALADLFVEVVAAPSFTAEALERLAKQKKRCRVLVGPATPGEELVLRAVRGGLLVQTPDRRGVDEAAWRVVTQRAPSDAERRALAFAWLVVKHVKSNGIVLARGTATVGIGGGETNRVDAVRLAAGRAGDNGTGAVVASDAFFPFADGLEAAAAAGATACIQPGGSKRDDEVIAAADRLGVAMVFTGERHFRH